MRKLIHDNPCPAAASNLGGKPSIVFLGCARNCSKYLTSFLNNLEQVAGTCKMSAFVFAHNDSSDSTYDMLHRWCTDQDDARIIGCDGLARLALGRTERLALLRNILMQEALSSHFCDYEYICIADCDEVNTSNVSPYAFSEAVRFLQDNPSIAAVFPASQPVYYDIWALRHGQWCPTDCWGEVRSASFSDKILPTDKYIYRRQVPIDSDQKPIEVESAFGGLAIYVKGFLAEAKYCGLNKQRLQTCEHVSFNSSLRCDGKKLYIFPKLQNLTAWEHCLPADTQEILIEGPATNIQLAAPKGHQLSAYLNHYPLYDRRLGLLLKILGDMRGPVSLLDAGSNILDTIAVAISQGAKIKQAFCIDASLEFTKYALWNQARIKPYVDDLKIFWMFLGNEKDSANILANSGTGSVLDGVCKEAFDLLNPPHRTIDEVAPDGVQLLKLDLDGYDFVVLKENINYLAKWRPIIWTEAHIVTAGQIREWTDLLDLLSQYYCNVAVFDNFGFCIASGKLEETKGLVNSLLQICWRYQAFQMHAGQPRIHYLDLLLTAAPQSDVFHSFLTSIPETRLRQALD
jgi:hypothetical protein